MTAATAEPRASSVSKDRKKTPKPPSDDVQVTFRLSKDLHARVKAASKGLELDVSSLLRQMIRKQLPHAEREAAELRRLEENPEEAQQ